MTKEFVEGGREAEKDHLGLFQVLCLTTTKESLYRLSQNVDKRHFWRLSFCIFKNILSHQKSDLEQNKKAYPPLFLLVF